MSEAQHAYLRENGKWLSAVRVGTKLHRLGLFATKAEAAATSQAFRTAHPKADSGVAQRARSMGTFVARFWARVHSSAEPDECWPWVGSTDKDGYGTLRSPWGRTRAPRVAFFLSSGLWPQPYALHRCGTPACCNPRHISEGTAKDNADDREAMGRTARGERAGGAKLTEVIVREVKRRAGDGESARTISEALGVSSASVWGVINGRNWRHVQ